MLRLSIDNLIRNRKSQRVLILIIRSYSRDPFILKREESSDTIVLWLC